MNNETPIFSVSDALAVINQSLEYAFPSITVVGEVASFKVNQGKWVFFDIKDDEASLGCFMSLFNLRVAVEDGMKVAVVARPGLTKWGKFSLTVQSIRPVGEGSLKRAFELLKFKLEKEGMFAPERKRTLPTLPRRIGVISSVAAAGYADFVKILDERFGGLEIAVANVQVQGVGAPEQIINALGYFNQQANPPEVIAILRGGGSADDLAAFNDEPLVRAIASSRVPTIVGVGHEVDVTLADLAADVRAATPSNAAQILVPDKREIIADVNSQLGQMTANFVLNLDAAERNVKEALTTIEQTTERLLLDETAKFNQLDAVLRQLNPRQILRRGYSLVRDASGQIIRAGASPGQILQIENQTYIIETEVKNARKKQNT